MLVSCITSSSGETAEKTFCPISRASVSPVMRDYITGNRHRSEGLKIPLGPRDRHGADAAASLCRSCLVPHIEEISTMSSMGSTSSAAE